MKIKKTLALLLALVMMLGCFTACGTPAVDTPETKAPAAENPDAETPAADSEEINEDELFIIELSVNAPVITDTLETDIGKYIAKEFGIAFKYHPIAGDHEEYAAMQMAGDTYEIFAPAAYGLSVKDYVDKGVAINFEDYKDLMPNYFKRFEKYIPAFRAATPDGGVYQLPWAANADFIPTPLEFFVRADVLAHYGYPELNSASSWLEFFKQAAIDFPTDYNDGPTVGLTMPLGEPYGLAGIVPLMVTYSGRYRHIDNSFFTYDYVEKKYVDYLEAEGTKDVYQWLNAMYKAGVLDPESLTDTQDITNMKMGSGSAIACYYTGWGDFNQQLAAAGHPESQYVSMPFTLDCFVGQPRPYMNDYSPGQSWVLTTKCPEDQIEKVLKLIDWSCSEEGAIMIHNGFEGVHWNYDENGVRVPTEELLSLLSDQEASTKVGLSVAGGGQAIYGLPWFNHTESDGKQTSLINDYSIESMLPMQDHVKALLEGYGWDSGMQWWLDNSVEYDAAEAPSMRQMSDEDLDEYNLLKAQLDECRMKYTANLILADDFEAAWNEFVTQYNKLDWQRAVELLNNYLYYPATE